MQNPTNGSPLCLQSPINVVSSPSNVLERSWPAKETIANSTGRSLELRSATGSAVLLSKTPKSLMLRSKTPCQSIPMRNTWCGAHSICRSVTVRPASAGGAAAPAAKDVTFLKRPIAVGTTQNDPWATNWVLRPSSPYADTHVLSLTPFLSTMLLPIWSVAATKLHLADQWWCPQKICFPPFHWCVR